MEFVLGILASLGVILLLEILGSFLLLPIVASDGAVLHVTLRVGRSQRVNAALLRGLIFLRETGVVWWKIAVILPAETLRPDDIIMLLCKKHHGLYVFTEDEYLDWVKQTDG